MQEILYRNGVFYINDRDKQSNFTFNNKDIDNIYEMKVSYKGLRFFEKQLYIYIYFSFNRKELFEKVKQGLRPSIEETVCSKDIIELIKKCWTENPNDRPDFSTIRDSMRKITKYKSKPYV
jgi:hypothetical protein